MDWKKLSNYLPEFVYGGIDGSITTFAVVAGATGASLDSSIVIILGLANLIADGFSMSVGSYLSCKSDQHTYDRVKREEYEEVEFHPEEGEKEIREIYAAKGFSGELLEKVVAKITADKDVWVDTMMKEEMEMTPAVKSPFSSGLTTFIAFLIMGFIPILVYVIDSISPLEISLFSSASVLTFLVFLGIGVLKSKVTQSSVLKGVVETVLLGVLAAGLAYFVGDILEQIIRS